MYAGDDRRAPYQQPKHLRSTQPQPSAHRPNQHAGLGTAHAPSNLPPPPNFNPNSQSLGGGGSNWTGEKFSLFVGNLVPGLEDGWLERILSTAGPVLTLRRPSPAFAFVEYGDAEAVLRCLEVVNGTVVAAKEGGGEKPILVKADEKTRARLDEYESTRVKDDQTNEFLLRAQEDLTSILSLINTGPAPPPTSSLSSLPSTTARPSSSDRFTPAHLQDLAPEDLAPEQRGIITSEIALFRERAAQKAKEKKLEEQRLEERIRANAVKKLSGGGGGGGGGREQTQGQGSQNNWGQRNTPVGRAAVDPQSYNRPVGFVKAGGSGATNSAAASGSVKLDEGAAKFVEQPLDDVQLERARLEKVAREAEASFRDRERRYEARERARITAVERERAKERIQTEQEDRDRVLMMEAFAVWDDEVEIEKGRELFYSDRPRWRALRRPFRSREIDSDSRDRHLESQQMATLQRESEEFLARQADMFNSLTSSSLSTRLGKKPTDEPAVKLSFGANVNVASKSAATLGAAVGSASARPAAAVWGEPDEEDEGKKKRELIPLSYSDDEDDEEVKGQKKVLSEREKREVERNVIKGLPMKKDDLWAFRVPWGFLSESIINQKMAPFATKLIVEYLGGEEEELLNAVIEHLRAHKTAAQLVDELEPVLDEEVTEFVRKIWKLLVEEVSLAKAGI